MTDLITITREQYDAEIDAAYAKGRQDERVRVRAASNRAQASNKLQVISRFLQQRGWRPVATKENGREWVDSLGQFRIGVPNKLTQTTWKAILLSLASYYRKGEQEIEQEILSYGRK